MRLPAELFVENDSQDMGGRAGGYGERWESEWAGGVVLCPCFGEVYKDILLWGKRCPMPASPLKAMLMDGLQRSALLLSCFAKSQGVHVVDKADARGWCGVLVAGVEKMCRMGDTDCSATIECSTFSMVILGTVRWLTTAL